MALKAPLSTVWHVMNTLGLSLLRNLEPKKPSISISGNVPAT